MELNSRQEGRVEGGGRESRWKGEGGRGRKKEGREEEGREREEEGREGEGRWNEERVKHCEHVIYVNTLQGS